jgi:hypothetical protein
VAAAIVLFAAQVSFADITTDLRMIATYSGGPVAGVGDNLTGVATANLPFNADVTFSVYELQPTAGLSLAQVTFLNSSAALKAAIESFSFDGGLAALTIHSLAGATGLDAEYAASVTDPTAVATPATNAGGYYQIGTLTLKTPNNPGGTYTLDMRTGPLADINTAFVDGAGSNLYSYGADTQNVSTPNAGVFQFTLTPEPATMALLGIGFAVTLLRRRSR